eukprot:UN10750
MAIHFGRSLNNKNIRIGYNSMGAWASVNHFHFQFWEYRGPNGKIPIEHAKQEILTRTDTDVTISYLKDYPIKTLVFT